MSRKSFEAPDQNLWDELARTIKPLSRKVARKSGAARPGKVTSVSKPQISHTHIQRRLPTNMPPPLAQMDRRTAQRLGRGQMEPDVSIDLHGESVELARVRLLHFLLSQRQNGRRLVLVITGKGASPFARHTLHGTTHFHTPEREGRLRREVPMWLHEESFRHHVVGFQPAHPKHGGGGAFYVRLRKLTGAS